MISLKKSYARHLLQLALTLSLLRVDPENYIGFGWESQLALQNGDGWQLELRAAPLTDFPYSNRKALIPLIEDLVRFDRQTSRPSSYDVQTYLLNVQNEQISLSSAPIAPATPTIDTNNSSAPISSHQQLQSAQVNHSLYLAENVNTDSIAIAISLIVYFDLCTFFHLFFLSLSLSSGCCCECTQNDNWKKNNNTQTHVLRYTNR